MKQIALVIMLLLAWSGAAQAVDFIVGDSIAGATAIDLDQAGAYGRVGNGTYTATANNTVTKFKFYGYSDNGANESLWCCIYTVSGGVPSARALDSAKIVIGNSGGPAAWWSSATVSVALTNGVTYCMCITDMSSSGGIAGHYDATSGTQQSTQTAAGFGATWTSAGTNTREWTWYAEGTISGGAGTTSLAIGGKVSIGGKVTVGGK